MDTVIDSAGRAGRLVNGGSAHGNNTVAVAFPDGSEARVPADQLYARDGRLYLHGKFEELGEFQSGKEATDVAIPLAEETVNVRTETTEKSVRLLKVVQEHDEHLRQQLMREDVEIERVAVDRPVTGPVAAREEGETLVIPLVEEQIVWEKRLVIREELRIRKRRHVESVDTPVRLRREELIVPPDDKR